MSRPHREHRDTTADYVLEAALRASLALSSDSAGALATARQLYADETGCTPDQARAALRRAMVRRGLRSPDTTTRQLAMKVHAR